jgi:hypothetical protein
MLLVEQFLFVSQGRSVGPEKEKGIGEKQIGVAAQNTETGIYQIVGKIIRMPDNSVYSPVTEDYVANENALGGHMEKTAGSEQCEANKDA